MKKRRIKRRKKMPFKGIMALIIAIAAILAIVAVKINNSKSYQTGNITGSVYASVSEPVSSSESDAAASADTSKIASKAASSKISASSSSKGGTTSVQTVSYSSTDLLMLVNKTHALSKSFKPDLTKISIRYYYSSGKDNRFNSVAAPYLVKMIKAAAADGVTMKIISGYRTYAYQEWNFNDEVSTFKKKNYTSAAAVSAALVSVAYPGTSEHETGLAADIITPDWYSSHDTLTSAFASTNVAKWLYKHSAEYGFILRYPKGKEDITGYEYEPWHYRFVGVENAEKIMSSGLCFEEWLEKNS